MPDSGSDGGIRKGTNVRDAREAVARGGGASARDADIAMGRSPTHEPILIS